MNRFILNCDDKSVTLESPEAWRLFRASSKITSCSSWWAGRAGKQIFINTNHRGERMKRWNAGIKLKGGSVLECVGDIWRTNGGTAGTICAVCVQHWFKMILLNQSNGFHIFATFHMNVECHVCCDYFTVWHKLAISCTSAHLKSSATEVVFFF